MKLERKFIVFDMETDSLSSTRMHVLSYHNLHTGERGNLRPGDDIEKFFSEEGYYYVGHNILRWDRNEIERLFKFDITATMIDTLAISFALFPENNLHGLDHWGQLLGIAKPKIDNWENLSQEEYDHRCEEDVKINVKLLEYFLQYLLILYNNNWNDLMRYCMYLSFKFECVNEQTQIGWKLDVEKVKENVEFFKKHYEEKYKTLSDVMPLNIKKEIKKKPKKPYKKDGSLSVTGERWFGLIEELNLPEDTQEIEVIKSTEEGNPQSIPQLKSWLYSLGWEPVTFKYERQENGNFRKIEQISLPKTQGGGICNSVKALYLEVPDLEHIESFYVVKHRLGILERFLEDVSEDGYLKADLSGFTNTLRLKHKELVNLPGYTGKGDFSDGIYIRGCLIAPKGKVLCGSDMSSLEDRTKQHYMYYFDPDYVNAMNKPGFDPHLDLAEFAYGVTEGRVGLPEEDIEWFKTIDSNEVGNLSKELYEKYKLVKEQRSLFKQTNYSCVYGVGAPTMSRSSKMDVETCQIIIDAYWLKNFSVTKVAKSVITKSINLPDGSSQRWLYNPVSKFWYTLRHSKDIFSTLNQGTGVYAFDRWVYYLRKRGHKMCGQFHDEVAKPLPYTTWDMNMTKKDFKECIEEVNKELNLNRPLGIDIQFGKNYAEIH